MSDFTPLLDPPCGAISPDGNMCPSDSTVMVVSECPTGYVTMVWRCHEHLAGSVETAIRVSRDAVVTVTPLAIIDRTNAPSPDSATSGQPPLRPVR